MTFVIPFQSEERTHLTDALVTPYEDESVSSIGSQDACAELHLTLARRAAAGS